MVSLTFSIMYDGYFDGYFRHDCALVFCLTLVFDTADEICRSFQRCFEWLIFLVP